MILLGLWIVRLGLRPLDADGQDGRRDRRGRPLAAASSPPSARTEVGRLGLALNSMLAHIEAAVTARDASLRALEASESKLRRFVADASHELRTPLAAVRAYAELFTRGAAERPDDLERSMKGISRESERMSVLVEDLLLLAHLDEGRPLEREPVALDEVVGEALETARTLEPERPIDVDARAAAPSPGDRDRLRQVVDNLLSNVALAHAARRAAGRDARARPRLGRPRRRGLRARDGRATRSRTSSSASTAPTPRAPARAAVPASGSRSSRPSSQAHGGKVDAESAPGRGTTFRVRLPLATG